MQKTFIKTVSLIALGAFFTVATILISSNVASAAQPTVNLRTASPFAILSGTPNITDAGNASQITGNVGLSPATGAGNGIACSQVVGTIYSVDASGPLPCRVTNGPLLVTAKNNLTTAYDDAAGRTPVSRVDTELSGQTLVAGVYDSASQRFDISAGDGPLVLDGQNDPSSVFIFQVPFEGNGLTVGPGSTVSLINGAQACNVFWRVDTASIDTTAVFVGTILALNSISVANGADIEGRLLARNGNVTLINDTITVPICEGNDTTEETDEGNGNVVIPGLPNTGEMGGGSILLVAVATLLATVSSLIAFVAYKKHSA